MKTQVRKRQKTVKCDRCGKRCDRGGYKDGQTGRPICDSCHNRECGIG